MASHSHNLLSALNTELVFLEAQRSDFVQLSSKMTFSAKKLKHVKSVFCIAKNIHFIEKSFYVVALLLKLHLATFSD